jgi:hypothetical protein
MRLLAALIAAPLAAAPLAAQAAAPAQPAPVQPAPVQPTPAQPTPGQPGAAARPAAADHPPLLPTREASVLYRVSASNAPPVEVRITSQPNGAAMRIDMPDHTYMLVSQAQKRMAMVVPNELMVMDLPYQAGMQDQFLLNSRMKFSRRGPDIVAGVRCTGWDVVLDGNRGIAWVTDDGVLLRSISLDPQGRRNLIEAISVSYTPAPAADYLPPEGFDHMAGPGGTDALP